WSKDNVLGVPFTDPSDRLAPLCKLGLVAGMVGIVLAMVGLPIAAYHLGRALARPIREMRSLDKESASAGKPGGQTAPVAGWRRATRVALDGWLRATRALTHARWFARLLATLGANPRSAWLFAATIVPWA